MEKPGTARRAIQIDGCNHAREGKPAPANGANEVDGRELGRQASRDQQTHEDDREDGSEEFGALGVADGHGLDACVLVVLLVLVGVDGVVDDGPEDVADEEADGGNEMAVIERVNSESGAGHEDGPGEGKAEDDLGEVRGPLSEGIDAEQDDDGDGVIEAGGGQEVVEGEVGEGESEGEEIALAG